MKLRDEWAAARNCVADASRALASIGDRDPALASRYRFRLQQTLADLTMPADLRRVIEAALERCARAFSTGAEPPGFPFANRRARARSGRNNNKVR